MADQISLEDIEQFLPGLECFLRDLENEPLSKSAASQSKFFLEKLDILKLPEGPGVPPLTKRNRRLSSSGDEGRPKGDDFIAHQRLIARQSQDKSVPGTPLADRAKNGVSVLYDDVVDGTAPQTPLRSTGNADNMYEEPQVGVGKGTLRGDLPYHQQPDCPNSDNGSGTSYESYDETYENSEHISKINTDVLLPRVKSKKKKKRTAAGDITYSSLSREAIRFEGEVYHLEKSAFSTSWTRRLGVVTDSAMFCFKDKESKVLITVQLKGWDVVCLDREKNRSNVIRITHPGCETFHFSWDRPREMDQWREVLCSVAQPELAAASSMPGGLSIETDYENSAPLVKTEQMPSMSSIGSEGGYTENSSSPTSPITHVRKTVSQEKGKEKKKKNMIPNILKGTFGKKKGGKIAQQLDIGDVHSDLSAKVESEDFDITGPIFVRGLLLRHNPTDWVLKHCAIRRSGEFECYSDETTELEFSVRLSECSMEALKEEKRPLALRFFKEKSELFKCEFNNVMEHGQWLMSLMKHIESSITPPSSADGVVPAGSRSSGSSSVLTGLGEQSEEDDTYTYMEADEPQLVELRRQLGSRPGLGKPPAVEPEVEEEHYSDQHALNRKDGTLSPDSRNSNRDSEKNSSWTPSESLSPTKGSDVNSNVIVCSSDASPNRRSGPTIDNERDVLDSTKNPILAQLRQERSARSSPAPSGPGPSPVNSIPKTMSSNQVSGTSNSGEAAFKKSMSAPRLLDQDTTGSQSSCRAPFSLSPVSDTESSAPSFTSDVPPAASVARSRALFEKSDEPARPVARTGSRAAGTSSAPKWTKPTPIMASVNAEAGLGTNYGSSSPRLGTHSKSSTLGKPASGLTPAPNKWSTSLTVATPATVSSVMSPGVTTAGSSTGYVSSTTSSPSPSPMLGVFAVNPKKPPLPSTGSAGRAYSRDHSPAAAFVRVSSESDSSSSGGNTYITSPSNGDPNTSGIGFGKRGSVSKVIGPRGWRAASSGECRTAGSARDPSAETEEDIAIKKELEQLRNLLADIRKERTKIKAERLAANVPSVKEKLDHQYKDLELRYKQTNQQIEELDAKHDERAAERYKISVEKRRSFSRSSSFQDTLHARLPSTDF